MKDCRDCKWCERAAERRFDGCSAPSNTRGFFASTQRGSARDAECGREAKHFDPKPPPVAWRDRISMAWRILRGEVQPETKQEPPAYVVGQWSEE